jgi:hypothetical protein
LSSVNLSFNSKTMRSAVFLPIPGALVSRLTCLFWIAQMSFSLERLESRPSPALGPILDTEINLQKTSYSN